MKYNQLELTIWKREDQWKQVFRWNVKVTRFEPEIVKADIWGEEFSDLFLAVRWGQKRWIYQRKLIEGEYKWVFVKRDYKK